MDEDGRYLYNGAVGPYGSAYCYEIVQPQIPKHIPSASIHEFTLSRQQQQQRQTTAVPRSCRNKRQHIPNNANNTTIQTPLPSLLVTPPARRKREQQLSIKNIFSYLQHGNTSTIHAQPTRNINMRKKTPKSRKYKLKYKKAVSRRFKVSKTPSLYGLNGMLSSIKYMKHNSTISNPSNMNNSSSINSSINQFYPALRLTNTLSRMGATTSVYNNQYNNLTRTVTTNTDKEICDEEERRSVFSSFQWKNGRLQLQTDRATAVITHSEEEDVKQIDSWLQVTDAYIVLQSSFYAQRRETGLPTLPTSQPDDVDSMSNNIHGNTNNNIPEKEDANHFDTPLSFPLPVIDNVIPKYPWVYTLGSYNDSFLADLPEESSITEEESSLTRQKRAFSAPFQYKDVSSTHAPKDDPYMSPFQKAMAVPKARQEEGPWQCPRSPTWVDNVYVDCILRLILPASVFNSWFQRFFSKFGLPLQYIYQAVAALLGGIAPSIFRALLTLFPWFREEVVAIHSVIRIILLPFELFYSYICQPVVPLLSNVVYFSYLAMTYTVSFFLSPLRLLHTLLYVFIASIREAAKGVWSYYELATLRETLYLVWSQSVLLRDWLHGISDTIHAIYTTFILQCSDLYYDVIVKQQQVLPALYTTYSRLTTEIHAGLMNTVTFLSRQPEFGLKFNLQLPFGVNLPLIIVNGAQDVASIASNVARSRLKQMWDVLTNSTNFIFKLYQVRLKATQNRTVSEGLDSITRTLISEGGLTTERKKRPRAASRGAATPFSLPIGLRRRLVSPTAARSQSNIRKKLVFSEERKKKRTNSSTRYHVESGTPGHHKRRHSFIPQGRSSRTNTPGLSRPKEQQHDSATTMLVQDLNYDAKGGYDDLQVDLEHSSSSSSSSNEEEGITDDEIPRT